MLTNLFQYVPAVLDRVASQVPDVEGRVELHATYRGIFEVAQMAPSVWLVPQPWTFPRMPEVVEEMAVANCGRPIGRFRFMVCVVVRENSDNARNGAALLEAGRIGALVMYALRGWQPGPKFEPVSSLLEVGSAGFDVHNGHVVLPLLYEISLVL